VDHGFGQEVCRVRKANVFQREVGFLAHLWLLMRSFKNGTNDYCQCKI
jgi:hypothetical protein